MTIATRREMLAAAATAAVAPAIARASEPAAPLLSHVFTARVTVAPAIEHGMIDGKRKRFIPITGGTISGPRLSGTILPGGGDWQAIHADGITEVMARYSMKAADGAIIGVTNPGVRVAAPDIIARIARGEDVDPAFYYFRSTPSFEVEKGPHDWLRRKLFVARGIRKPDHVVIAVYEVG
jgi:hypothetical protein